MNETCFKIMLKVNQNAASIIGLAVQVSSDSVRIVQMKKSEP